MANLPTNIGINVKTPTARTAGGVAGDAGKNVTPIHKPLNPNNHVSNPTAGMERARGLLQGQTQGMNELGWGENAKIRRGTTDTGSKPTLVKGMPGSDMLNTKVSGSNKDLAKKKLMGSSAKDPIQKHPLVRNTGESSAEGRYRNARKPIPVKKSK